MRTGPGHADDTVPATPAVSYRTSFDELQSVGPSLYWLESGSGTGSQVAEWSSAAGTKVWGAPVGSAIHAYGGGSYAVVDGVIWAVDPGSSRAGPLGQPVAT